MDSSILFKFLSLPILYSISKPRAEGSERKTFKIETQSTRSERRNIGYNVLDSIKKMMLVQIAHPGKMKHDLFKLEDLSISPSLGILEQELAQYIE
jgi:hypothetical protein